MAVKKYEVEGTVYNVSEKGSEEFFKDFEGKEIISLDDDKDKDPEPKKATGAAQGVVAGPQMPQEIIPGFMPQPAETPESTELVSENISSDSPDPEPKKTSDREVLPEIVVKAESHQKRITKTFGENIYKDFSAMDDDLFNEYSTANNSILFNSSAYSKRGSFGKIMTEKENLKNGPQAEDLNKFLKNNPNQKVSIFIDNADIPDYRSSLDQVRYLYSQYQNLLQKGQEGNLNFEESLDLKNAKKLLEKSYDTHLKTFNTFQDRVSFINLHTERKKRSEIKAKQIIKDKKEAGESDFNINYTVSQAGKGFLSTLEKNISSLQEKYENASGEEKVKLKKLLDKQVNADDYGKLLYDPATGKTYDLKRKEQSPPSDLIKSYEKSKNLAFKTDIDVLNNQRSEKYYQLVSYIQDYYSENSKLTGFADDKEKYSTAIKGAIENGILPNSEITQKLFSDTSSDSFTESGYQLPLKDKEFQKNYKKTLNEFIVLNRAIQLNRNISTSNNEELALEFGDALPFLEIQTSREEAEVFLDILSSSGEFEQNDIEKFAENTKLSFKQEIARGTPELGQFIFELAAFRKITGNTVNRTTGLSVNFTNKFFKGNRVAQFASKAVINSVGEGAEFMGTTAMTNILYGENESLSKSFQSGAALGFAGAFTKSFVPAVNKKWLESKYSRKAAEYGFYRGAANNKFLQKFSRASIESSVGASTYIGSGIIMDPLDYEYDDMSHTFGVEWWKMFFIGRGRKVLSMNKQSFQKTYEEWNDVILKSKNLNTQSLRATKVLGIDKNVVANPTESSGDIVIKASENKKKEINKKVKAGEITSEEAAEQTKQIESSVLNAEGQIAINEAKIQIAKDVKDGKTSTEGERYILGRKIKSGIPLNDKDSKAISNTSPEGLTLAMGVEMTSENIAISKEIVKNNEIIQGLLNGQIYAPTSDGYIQISNKQGEFKALDSKLREETYKFLVERTEAGGLVDQLKSANKEGLTTVEQENLNEAIKEAELNFKDFSKEGYKYIELQAKLQEDATKRYEADIKKGKRVEESGVKGTLEEAKTTDEFVKLYEKAGFKSNERTKDKIAFTDSEGNRVVNRVKALEVRDTSAATHEGWHAVLTDSLKDSSGNVTTEGIKVIDNILGSLTPIQRKALDTDVFSRYDTSLPKSKWYEENLTILSEHISDGRIKFSKSIGEQLTDLAQRIKGGSFKNLEIDATTGKGMFEMLEGFAKGEKKAVEAAGKFAKKEADKSEVTPSDKPSFSEAADSKTKQKLDSFTGPAENRKFKTKREWESSREYIDAYNYFTDSNPKLDARIKSIAASKGVDFIDVDKVKDVLSMRFVKNFNIEKNSLFGWMLGKNPALQFAVLDVIKKETAEPATMSTTTREGGVMEVADESMSIEDQIDFSLANRSKQTVESQIKTTIKKSGEQFIDENLRGTIKTGAEDIFSKQELITRRELKKALKNKVNEKNIESYNFKGKTLKNTSIFTITKKKIGKLPDFIEENYKSLFHTQNIPISYLVNFERLTPEAEKIFTGSPVRLTNQKLIDKAIKTGDFYVENEKTGPMFYSRKKPSLDEIQEFFKVRGRDNAFVNMLAGTAITDAVPGAMKKLEAEDKKIAETALKLGVDVNVQFSNAIRVIKDQRIIEITDSKVAQAIISRINTGKIKGKIDYTSASIQEEVLKDSSFGVKDARGFNNIVKKYNNGTLSPTLTTKLGIISSKALFANEIIQKQILANQNYQDNSSRSYIKDNTGLNIESPTKKHYYSSYFKEYVPELQKIIKLFPGSLKSVQKSKTGDTSFSALSATFAYDGWGEKSRLQFQNDTKNYFGKEFGKSKEAKEIWEGYNEHVKKHPKTEAIFQKSDGAQITLLGRATNIINNPKTSLKQKAKRLQGIWKDLRLSNERNNLYHNAIIKTIDLHLTKNYKTQSERNEAIEKLAPMLANNRGNSFRIASLFEIFKIDAQGKLQNEHLYESAKYKAGVINLLKEGNVTSFDLAELNKDYISALVPAQTRRNSDAALNDIISPEMNYFLKLVSAKGRKGVVESIAGIDIQKITESGVIKELNTFIHAPSGKLLGDYAVDEAIKNSEKPNKNNLETLKKLGVNIENVKTNNQALFILDKIENSVNKRASFSNPIKLNKGEIEVFHGGSIKSVKDIKGFAYFSRNKNQAAEYAKVNEGKVKSFTLNEKDIVNEDVVFKEIKKLGLKSSSKEGFKVDELNLYELIDPNFETALSKSDLTKLSQSLSNKGIKAVRFTDMNLTTLKNDIQNIVVIDKSVVKESSLASLDLNKTFNKIIEGKTGIKADDVYSKSRGSKAGKGKGRFDIIPPSAEDFVGLLYKTLGKGKEGDAQMDFYKKHLIDPFARGDEAITNERNALMRDFKQVKKEIVESIGGTNWKGVSPLTKKLKNKIGDQDYTGEDAVRMYIWRKQGMEIPEIDKAEVDAAISSLAKDPILVDFANKIRTINRGRPYTAPEKGWAAGNIATDFLSGINTEGRAKHLEEWQANVDAVFSKENLNKLEGAFGTNYRKAMENMLKRMKSGKNRDVPKDKLSGRVTDWINNSTGAIMFFNQRSSVLQLMSATNFVNLTDNNIFKAGTAFANQPQYWKDFKTLFNSEYLKNRRGGLEFNVTESEIADLAKQGGVRGVISKILKVGFTPTQIADSFAIASGGATFFRNRFKTYLNETNAEGEKVYTEKQAKEKAFLDFKETAEESQQSSRPDKISQQQASNLGRLVLSFANTPSQYARIIKKATLDLKNGRGDKKTNISKIAYYTFLTNLVFNGLQKALFTEALDNTDDDEKSDAKKRKEQEKRQSKYLDVANGMISSYLRGTGVRGNVISTLKDMGLEVYKQQGKTVQDYDRVADAALGFSPPLRYKYIQMKSAGRKFTYPGSREEIMDKGFSIDNPALMAGAQYTSALTNVPLDRALKKINNIVLATNSELEEIQRIGLVLGWSAWDLGIEKPKKKRRGSSNKRKSSIKKSSIRRSTIK